MEPTPQSFTVKNNPFNWRNTRLLSSGLIIACGIALSACGGSSSSSRGGSAPAENKTTVEGTAAKGLLKNARVEICTNTTCSGDENPLAIGSTDINGNYTLPVKVSGNQVLITKVSYQEGAQMVCDVPAGCVGVEFGKDVPMPDDLSLRSMVTAEPSSTSVSAHVNPLTELATIAAQKSLQGIGVLTAEAMNNGDAAIRKLFGLGEGASLSSIQPVDVTKDAAEGDAAALVSLLSAAFAGDAGANLFNTFSTAVETGGSVQRNELNQVKNAATEVVSKNPKLAKAKEALEKANESATSDCVEECDVNVDEAELPAAAKTELSNNVKAVKALVSDVRTIGFEIYPQLKAEVLQEPASDDSLISRINSASEIFSEEFSLAAQGLSEVSSLLLIAIAHKNRLDDEFDIGDNPTLSSIAKQVFLEDNDYGYGSDEYNCDGEEYGGAWCWSPAKLAEKANAYAAQFGDSKITVTDNKNWKITDAAFTKENAETVAINLEISNVPYLANGTTYSELNASITGDAAVANTQISLLEDATLKAKLTRPITFEKDGERVRAKEAAIMPYIDTIDVNARVSIAYTGEDQSKREFIGKLAISGGTNANLRTKNGENNKVSDNIFAILPKKVTVEGKFTDEAIGSVLEAKLTATLDNYDSYWYHAENTPTDIPISFALSGDKKSLMVKLGKDNAENRLSYTLKLVDETWQEIDYSQSGEWIVDENGSYIYQRPVKTTTASFIRIDSCTAVGDARCPHLNEWEGYHYYDSENGDQFIPGIVLNNTWSEIVEEPEYCWNNETNNSYECGTYEYKNWYSEPAQFENIVKGLDSIKSTYEEYEYYYGGNWTWSWEYYQLFGQAYIKDVSAGYISLGDDDEDTRFNYVDLSKLSKGNYAVNAKRVDTVVVDEANNFAKATVTAELKAKLSANLPEMDIKLTAKRSDFDKARADLTLAWKKPNEVRRSITLSALAQGRTAEQLEQSLQFLIADHEGTAFTLALGENERFAGGKIVKDGTTYATISKEGSAGVYIVTYHYDDQGNKADSRSEEFESLF